jgi:hypothetical protein
MKKLLVLLLVLCTALTLVGCGGNTYKEAVTDYLEVHRDGKVEKLENLAPQDVIDQLKQDTGFNIATRQNDIKEYHNGLLKSLKSLYGDDYEFSVEVTFKEEVSENELKEIKNRLNERYGIEKKRIKDLINAVFEIKHSGSKKEKIIESDVLVVKIDDTWYVCNENGDFGITNNQLNN